MNRCKKYMAVLIAVMMFATSFITVNPVRVSAKTTENTVIEATVTGGVIKFDTSTGTVTGLSSIGDTGALIIPETIEGVTVKAIGQQAFMSKQNLISVELPDTVELIDQLAFNNCMSLETVKLPAGLIKINSYAFSYCYKLKSIELPEGLKYIYGMAFNECTSLTSVKLPASLIEYVKVFTNCTSLKEITVDSNNESFDSIDGVLFDADGLVCYPGGKAGSEYAVPDNEEIKYIESSAFSGAANLTVIHMPGNITELKSYAIDNCNALKTVTFDEGLLLLSTAAISNSSIETISFPDSLQSIYRNSLFNCRNLTEVNIGTGLTTINYNGSMFSACSSLQAINVAEGNGVFSSADGVLFDKNKNKLIAYPVYREGANYNIPESVTEIGDSAFSYAGRLQTLQIPDSVKTIGESILSSTVNKVSIVCNEGSAAETYAKENGHSTIGTVVETAVSGGVIKFDTSTGTVTECVSLDGSGMMEIPEEIEGVPVKAIGNLVFSKEKTLTKVVLPNTIESIGERAFAESGVSGNFYIPASVTVIGSDAFADCKELTDINVADGNTVYRSENGVLFDADTLVLYPVGKTAAEYVMPMLEGVSYIGSRAFAGASLRKTVIAEGVTSIQEKAFYECTSLSEVAFPSTLKYIRAYAFYGTALETVTVPDSVIRIWSRAFDECTKLTQVNLPANIAVHWDGNVMLDGCDSLTAINVAGGGSNFVSDNGVLFSSDGTILWRFPQNHPAAVYEVPEGVIEIKPNAFSGCVGLQEIILPDGLEKIGSQAFENCDSLQSISIPESVTEIEDYAFTSCDYLKVVTIPSSVKTIGSQIFYNMKQEVVIICDEGSAAAEYAANNALPYSYDGKTIVGTGEEFENPDPVQPAKSEQEIVCDDTFEKVYGCEPFALEASAKTALVYKSGDTNVADVDAEGNVTIKAAGDAVITITAAESEEYLSAEKTVTIRVVKADQEISGAAEFSKVYGDAEFDLEQTAQTELTYKSNNTVVADVSEDGTVTINGAGTATITVTAAVGSNYNGTEKTVMVTVTKANQSISGAAEFSKVYGDAEFDLDQTAQTELTYKSNNTAVVDVDVEGNVTVKGAGEATITITAATGENYNTAEKTVVITVAKADQSISGAAEFSKVYGDAEFDLDQTAQTALTYKSNNTAVADVSEDGTVTVKGAGQATITITAVTGDNYNAAEKTVTIRVVKADQEISGAAEFSKVYGDAEFDLEQTAETDLTYKSNNTAVADVSEDGTVTINGAGTANITVTANAGADYNSAEKTVVIKVAKSAQSIVCDTAISKPYGSEAFNIGASAKTTLYYKSNNTNVADIDKDGTVTIKNAGQAVITITAADSTNYIAVEVKVTITVSKVDQSIECEDEFVVNEGSGTFNLNASAKTAISYKSNNTDIADVDDEGKVIVNGPGTAVITINAEEGINYNSAKKAVTVIVNKVEEPDDPIVEPEDPAIPSEPVVPDEPTVEPDEPTTPSEPDEPAVEPEAPTEPQEKQEQIITGTSKYVKIYKAGGSFYLDASAKTALTYSSSNTAVVKVAADGKITIKGSGKANITVTAAENGEYKSADKTIAITISKAAQKITCKKTFSKTFKPNGYFYLKAKSPTKKTYKSSNKKIATVSATGKVTMKNPGKVTITITAREGKNYKKVIKKVTVTFKMKKPALTVKAQKGKKNKLSWTKVPGAHGYKVYIYDKSKGKYVCRVTKKANVKSVTHKGLKAGKTYKYKVRAYRVVNGKMVYSPYSVVRSMKAKK